MSYKNKQNKVSKELTVRKIREQQAMMAKAYPDLYNNMKQLADQLSRINEQLSAHWYHIDELSGNMERIAATLSLDPRLKRIFNYYERGYRKLKLSLDDFFQADMFMRRDFCADERAAANNQGTGYNIMSEIFCACFGADAEGKKAEEKTIFILPSDIANTLQSSPLIRANKDVKIINF